MSPADVVILILLAVAFVFVLRSLRKQRKNGGCPGGCSGCAHSCSCCSKTPENNEEK